MIIQNLPIVYIDNSPVAIIELAFNITVTSALNGESTLDFDVYFSDVKRKYLENEVILKLGDTLYRIKTITDSKESYFLRQSHVYAENIFYDLSRAVRTLPTTFDDVPAKVALSYALQGTIWSFGVTDITITRSFISSEDNPLALLQTIAEIYNGELRFNSMTKTVDLLNRIGADNGVTFTFRKNMTSVERVIDTSSLITRMYATGADGMTFSSINNGLPYVDNFSYSKNVIVGSLDCSKLLDKKQMLDFTINRLSDSAKPKYSYSATVSFLAHLKDFFHEQFSLGDTVRVYDEELGIDIFTRIVRVEIVINEPWKTKIELSTSKDTLSKNSNKENVNQNSALIQSFVAPRLLQATINETTGEINAMYELGIPVKYSFEKLDNGIVFHFADGKDCEIIIIN